MVGGNLVESPIKTNFGSSQHGHSVDVFGLGARPGVRPYGARWEALHVRHELAGTDAGHVQGAGGRGHACLAHGT